MNIVVPERKRRSNKGIKRVFSLGSERADRHLSILSRSWFRPEQLENSSRLLLSGVVLELHVFEIFGELLSVADFFADIGQEKYA